LFYEEAIKQDDIIGDLLTCLLFIGCGLLFYWLPISILIEKITNKIQEGRIAFSFVLYAYFCFLPFFILWFFTLFSFTISILFFIIGELLKYYDRKRQKEVSMF